MIATSQIVTGRLNIRRFVRSDAEALVGLFEEPRVHRFVGDGVALSIDDARLWVERSRENIDRFGYGTGAVVERGSSTLIGWAGFARPGDGSEEIVYGLAPERWGRGYGSEIVAALLRFAEERGIAPVRATVDPNNCASIRLLDRAGFRLVEKHYRGQGHTNLYVHG